jgi:hypothetical protein
MIMCVTRKEDQSMRRIVEYEAETYAMQVTEATLSDGIVMNNDEGRRKGCDDDQMQRKPKG